MAARLGAALVVAALLAGAPACGRLADRQRITAAPKGPQAAAMDLFALARPRGFTEEELPLLLEDEPGGRDRAALAAALKALAPAESPRVVAVEPLPVTGRIAVEVVAGLPGGGALRYSAQAARRGDGTWRVVSFETPSGSWPRRRPAPGEGLSSSAPSR